MTWKQDKYGLIVHYPANCFQNTGPLVKDLVYRLPNQNEFSRPLPLKNKI